MANTVTFNNFDYSEVDISDSHDSVYAPDFTVQRRPDSHTMRKYAHDTHHEYLVKIIRPECVDGIPVTEMDEYLGDCAFRSYDWSQTIPLQKKELYERFIFDIEEQCVEKSTTYDKKENLNKTKYKVPAIGLLVDHQPPSYGTVSGAKYSKVDDDDEHKFIMIRNKMYPINKYYRECGLDFGEIKLPENYFSNISLCEDNEAVYNVSKVGYSKGVMTYSFHHSMKISSLVIRPELMKFKQVSGDNSNSRYDRMNPSLLRKKKYHINVLENEPGFVSKFEMQFRSELTNNQWMKFGVFNGNVSISDSTKISFDEIVAKEIRIIPLSFHNSFEHIQVNFIGKCPVKTKSDEIFVTYEVSVPRDGKYLGHSSKICDSFKVPVSEFRTWNKEAKRIKKREDRHDMHQKIVYDS